VPNNALGKLEITAEFDPAPLAPVLHASQTIEVRK
jgi:hypothetical protein